MQIRGNRKMGPKILETEREHHAILQEQKLKSSEPFWKKIHRAPTSSLLGAKDSLSPNLFINK